MGVDYRAVAAFGLVFKTKKELNEYLEQNDIEENDVAEELYENLLGMTCLDNYSGKYWILGYYVELGVSLDVYQNQWNNDIKDTSLKPKAILEVMVY